MKKLFTLFILLTIYQLSQAQHTEGMIVYEDKINMHMNLPEDRPELKEYIPEFRTSKTILYFNSDKSFYKNAPKEEETQENGGRVRMSFRAPENLLYTNFSTKETVEQKDFMGKKFLIRGAPTKMAWKITGKQQKVGDYVCMQATYSDSTRNIEAWFTPQVPVPTGPSTYSQLPGLVLMVNIDQGARVLLAQEIQLESQDEVNFEVPTKGKEITREEFEEIVKKKTEEMKKNMGGRSFIIRQ